MVGRLTDILEEEARQSRQDDGRYLEVGIYFFELEFPSEAVSVGPPDGGDTQSYIFPLVLNPESIRVVDNFTLSKTPTANGGLYIEESGILERALVIRGTTGMKPRLGRAFAQAPGGPVFPTTAFNVPNPSFRERTGRAAYGALSGQKHFQFLQDKVFRIYGDLKRTPQFSELTTLNWHNPKDQEHFRIIPERFQMTRDIQRKFLYQYEIVCTIVGPANPRDADVIEPDQNVFDQINDAVRTVRKAITYANAAVADVNGFVNDLEMTFRGATGILNDAINVIGGVNAAVTSIERLGTTVATFPLRTARNAVTRVEQLAQNLTGLPFRVEQTTAQSLRNLEDAIDHFSLLPDIFAESPVNQLARDANRALGAQRSDRTALEAAQARAPRSAQEANARDSEPAPGDLARLQAPLYTTSDTPQIQSASAQTVQSDDNLAAIASRYLGDGRRWRELAAFNRLTFPYISRAGMPGTLAPGDTILIPSEAPPQNVAQTPGVYPGDPQVPAPERTLGRDFALVPDARGFVDFAVDPAAGEQDFLEVAGLDNLAQGLTTRVTTEQGTDTLYKRLGYKQIVGIGFASADADLARVRLGEAVLADPRITSLRSLTLVPGPIDAVQVRIEAAIRGFREPIQLNLSGKDYPLNTTTA